MGLTCSDQRQPGSKTPRPRVWLPTLTTSIFPFPSLNGRVSSGLLRDFRSNAVICLLQKRSGGLQPARGHTISYPTDFSHSRQPLSWPRSQFGAARGEYGANGRIAFSAVQKSPLAL